MPLAFLLVQVRDVGWGRAWSLLWRARVGELLVNTLKLTVAVTVLSVAIGLGAAWLVERTDLPFRRVFAVLLALPIAVPEYVSGAGWVSLFNGLNGFGPAVLVTTLSYFPLVYLPAVAVLRGSDPVLEETARGLGLGPWRTFARVTVPQLRLALLGGALVVALYLLAEYGAFAVLRYRTFTTEIFNAYKLGFDGGSASLMSLVLVLLCILVLGGERGLRGRSRHARVGPGSRRRGAPTPLGRSTPIAMLGLGGLVALSLGVPLGALAYWSIRGSSTTYPSASIIGPTLNTIAYGVGAAALATALALPVAMLAVRHRGLLATFVERAVYLPRALPGLVVGLALTFVAIRFAAGLYQQPALLVIAYVILFLPLALVALQPAVAQLTPGIEDAARSLGTRPLGVLRRVTLPLIAPGLGAAAALVFISSVTELTATLILRPTGTETLATQFWLYTGGLAYGAAAPYALLMMAISAVPTYVLIRRVSAYAGGPVT